MMRRIDRAFENSLSSSIGDFFEPQSIRLRSARTIMISIVPIVY
jgi:hypothetical protein